MSDVIFGQNTLSLARLKFDSSDKWLACNFNLYSFYFIHRTSSHKGSHINKTRCIHRMNSYVPSVQQHNGNTTLNLEDVRSFTFPFEISYCHITVVLLLSSMFDIF